MCLIDWIGTLNGFLSNVIESTDRMYGYLNVTQKGGDMVIGDIGETAGEIWTLLNQNGDMTMSGVASNVDRPKALVEMGLGWLAREEKISISKEKRGIRISLK